MTAYLLKICSQRKLANIRKYKQIRKPVVQKKNLKCLLMFLGKMSLPLIVYFSILNLWYKLTQPNVHIYPYCSKESVSVLSVCVIIFIINSTFKKNHWDHTWCITAINNGPPYIIRGELRNSSINREISIKKRIC